MEKFQNIEIVRFKNGIQVRPVSLNKVFRYNFKFKF